MSQTVQHDRGVLVMPRGYIDQRFPIVTTHLLPVCRSPQCADVNLTESNPTLTIYALVRAEAGMMWAFDWGLQHGVGACVNCGAWHQIYFYEGEPQTEEQRGRGERGTRHRVYREPELIDDRPEHNPPTPSFVERFGPIAVLA